MEVTHEGSMREYNRLLKDPPVGPRVPMKPSRADPYAVDGKSFVTVVRANSRSEGIREALQMIGGVKPLWEGVEGEIVIKPNYNTDDPFPRDTHPETIRAIAESLIEVGFPLRASVPLRIQVIKAAKSLSCHPQINYLIRPRARNRNRLKCSSI